MPVSAAIHTLMNWHAENPQNRIWGLAPTMEPGGITIELSELRSKGPRTFARWRRVVTREAAMFAVPDILDHTVKIGIREVAAGIEKGGQHAEVRHGVNCPKVLHSLRRGYLHGSTEDGPYDVDGVYYCGRCHVAL